MHHVFIYGTLKRGFPNHDIGMRNSTFIGRYRTLKPYPLVVGGQWFSPYLIDEPGAGLRVYGEIFTVNDQSLKLLDLMEGTHLPIGYRRISIIVEDDNTGNELEAWTYVKDRKNIDGIHSDSLDEYKLDSRYVDSSQRTNAF